jgi:RNA ligase
MNIDLLNRHIESGIINRQQHPNLPLMILNYSPRCQYERCWDDLTLQCRGLVIHGDRVVARPFRKFFNDTEHAEGEIPWHLPYEVTEKLDGSLLIVFHFEGEWHYSTRSFLSTQAQRGKQIFRQRYSESQLDTRLTYLFEVLYPENRIVVDYQGREDVILLAAIDTAQGNEVPFDAVSDCLAKVRRLPPDANAKDLRSIIRDDEEGYVVRFEDGFRVKVKGVKYMELHRLISGISSRAVWEALANGKSFDELLTIVPDEFGDWVRREKAAQIAAFDALNARTEQAYLAAKELPDRKAKALKILGDFKDVASAAFAAIDHKPTAAILWKQLYPEFRRPEAVGRIEA